MVHSAASDSYPLTMNNNMSNLNMNTLGVGTMSSDKVDALTKHDILQTAKNFRWKRQMPKWTVIVNGTEYPVHPLILEAGGVPPNDPTNSHQALAKLKSMGFDTRYEGKSV